MRTAHMVVLICLAGAWASPGCAPNTTIGAGVAYPAQLGQARTLDIQAFSDGVRLTMTNTTGGTIRDARVWVNAYYQLAIEPWAPGQTVVLSLDEFRDEYDAPYRAGGFFAGRNPDKVYQVQIEHADRLDGVVLVKSR
ncbi:MAG: hypothetical protein C0468_01320 [Planctomyces sp.]|nr:hypothetical protein [Planctomyces sp.]MBA4120340.1 hypothetical protein [Isosphaera sp.]